MSEVFNIIDYVGTFVFAITGASIAASIKFDFFGMLFLAFLTAVGGGTVRDIIISEPVFWTQDPMYLYLIFIATLSTFFLRSFYEKQSSLLYFLDTLGVATFVVIGTQKTLLLNFNMETAFIMGTISAVLGGILRSAFSGEFSILSNRELYATLAAAGALCFIGLKVLQLDLNLCAILTIIFTFVFRYIAKKHGIKLPATH